MLRERMGGGGGGGEGGRWHVEVERREEDGMEEKEWHLIGLSNVFEG